MNEKLFKSVLQGRADFFRSNAENSPLKGSGLHDEKERFFYSSGMDYAPCNGVIEKENKKLTEKEVDLAIHYFRGKKLPFIWWSEDKLLEKKGFMFGGVLKGMAADITNMTPFEIPKNLKIKQVDENELKVFSDIISDAFAMDPLVIPQFQSIIHLMEKEGDVLNFMAYVNDKPAGTLTLATAQLSAGIWNCATSPSYRRQGVMSALIYTALVEAKKRQYSEVMAILMPKGLAAGIFKSFNFKQICDFPFYVHGVAGPLEK